MKHWDTSHPEDCSSLCKNGCTPNQTVGLIQRDASPPVQTMSYPCHLCVVDHKALRSQNNLGWGGGGGSPYIGSAVLVQSAGGVQATPRDIFCGDAHVTSLGMHANSWVQRHLVRYILHSAWAPAWAWGRDTMQDKHLGLHWYTVGAQRMTTEAPLQGFGRANNLPIWPLTPPPPPFRALAL